jgi:hypothetical protein
MKGRNLGNPHPLDSFTKGNTTLGPGVRTVLFVVTVQQSSTSSPRHDEDSSQMTFPLRWLA